MGVGIAGLQSGASGAGRLAPGATGSSLTLSPIGLQIGWIGDSISVYFTSNAPAQYGSDTRYVQNWAQSGKRWTSGDIAAQYTNNVTNQTRIVCEGGVNDVLGGITAAAIAATSLAFVDARRAEGKQVVINNIGPWKANAAWNAGLQTVTTDYNALLVAAAAARPGLILVDLYSLWESAPGSQTLNPLYDSGDGLHPNSTGGAVWAAQVAVQAP